MKPKVLLSSLVLGTFLLSAFGSGEDDKKPLYEDKYAIEATAEKLIKQNLRDPDSYELISIEPEVGRSVVVKYRAKNGFGGYNVGSALVLCDSTKMILVANE